MPVPNGTGIINKPLISHYIIKYYLQGLKVVDFQMPDYLVVVERAIQFGTPVLLQNIQEELEPSLNPVLNKSLTRIGQSSANTHVLSRQAY